MKGIRVAGQAVVHAASQYVDFDHYSHTACAIRVNWTPDGNLPRTR